MKRFTLFAAVVILLAVMPASRVSAVADPQSQSAVTVIRLTALLDQLKLDAVAARDPDEPNRFVAAFYMPGSQLLVVSAPYKVPVLLDKKIAAGTFMDVYADLQSVAVHTGHFFVVDMRADGLTLQPKPDEPFDSSSIAGAIPFAFDGRWEAQKVTEQDYEARFAKDDARYTRMLTVLINALSRKTT